MLFRPATVERTHTTSRPTSDEESKGRGGEGIFTGGQNGVCGLHALTFSHSSNPPHRVSENVDTGHQQETSTPMRMPMPLSPSP
jgi:hypothetical protein